MFGIIGWMPVAIENDDLTKIKRRNALETGGVDSELIGVRSTLVVRVDAAVGAEVMLRAHRVEPVRNELVFSLCDAEVGGRGRQCDRSAHPADRTGATPRRREAFGQRHNELDHTAVARAVERDGRGRREVQH